MLMIPRGALRPFFLAGCLTTASVILPAAPASAGPIVLGTWYEFGFSDTLTPATGCFPDDPAGIFCTSSSGTPTTNLDAPPWTFAAGSVVLTVVDAFENGDVFEIFDFGVSIGVTSAPGRPADCGDDPVPCLLNAEMSKGLFNLAAGPHSLTIMPTQSPGGLGAAYLQVSAAAVPEPMTAFLLGSGLAVFGLRRSRRARR